MTLLRLATRCPRCARPPRIRIPPGIAERYDTLPPDAFLGTVQCHRCGKVYEITAAAYHHATAA